MESTNTVVHPKVAQQLLALDHKPAMDRYSHVDRDEQQSGLSNLPELYDYSSEAMHMTGTYGDERRDSALADCLAENGSDSRKIVRLVQ